jgi:DNA-3-methyladenine glycosylase
MIKASKPLPRSFYRRPAEVVAEDLMGRTLCRRLPGRKVLRGRINEVEAYVGPEDKAMHAYRGKTDRNAIMFAAGGMWYVYLCYGVHWLINIVTGPADRPEAVLIRGVEGITGPGRLTKAFEIGKAEQNQPVNRNTGLWIESGLPYPVERLERSPRIGINYAEEWVDKPLRWTCHAS